MKISYLLVALLLVSSIATSTTARTQINNIATRARSNVIEGRQIAAPPWSAACMTGHGPSECGEPMWIYGSRGEITRYRNAF
jgi:cytochrome c553